MTNNVKVNGVWKPVISQNIKVAGTWKQVRECYIKVNGAWKSWFLQGGLKDTGFSVNNTTNLGTVVTMALQPDGKIIVAGGFTSWGGSTVNRLVRINLDGSLDTNFMNNIGTGASSSIQVAGLQPDGKIILRSIAGGSGTKTTFNGVAVNSVLRLNSDGTRDTVFDSNIGGIGADIDTSSPTAVQSDGKIIYAGLFSSWNGVSAPRIVRLNADGTRDSSFVTNLGTGGANAILIQPDDKIILAGNFPTVNGTPTNQIVRLNLDGTLDSSFNLNRGTAANGTVRRAALQPDGKILGTGSFTNYNGVTANNIIRLNVDGTIDTQFTTNIGSGISGSFFAAIKAQDNGKIIINGNFTTFNGMSAPRIIRLNSDGTRDSNFMNNIGTGFDSMNNTAIVIMPDKKILIAGPFTTFNGSTQNGIIRIGGEDAF